MTGVGDDPERERQREALKRFVRLQRALDAHRRRLAVDPKWQAAWERLRDPQFRAELERWQELNRGLAADPALQAALERLRDPQVRRRLEEQQAWDERLTEAEREVEREDAERAEQLEPTPEQPEPTPESSDTTAPETPAPRPSDDELVDIVITEMMWAVFKDAPVPWPSVKNQWPLCKDKINSDPRLVERGIHVSRDDGRFDKVADKPEFQAMRRKPGDHQHRLHRP